MMYPAQRSISASCLLCLTAWLAFAGNDDRIRPWTENPWYWQYKGSPVLLIGGSDDDNLFQWPAAELRPHLDLMKQIGGNYVRNTMSDRPDRNWELYPFAKLPNGKYDLERWNPEYWSRLEQFLQMTAERDIIVQVEVWDRFDYSRANWKPHPYNPANNINYSEAESGLAGDYPEHPGRNTQPFFFTTPTQRNNTAVLRHQRRFVDKLLEHSLKYGHVLYCIDNETSGEEEWSRYWARYIRAAAAKAGVPVYITEMWDDWDLKAERHRRTFDNPGLYDFVDISQNNHNSGDKHWTNALWVRQYLSSHPRPINTVKTYGASGNQFGHTDQDGVERLWRHILAGTASARFHRPDSGLGLNGKAQAAIRSVRAMESLVQPWNLSPAPDSVAAVNGARIYAAASDEAWVLYFPTGGSAGVRTTAGPYVVRWIDVDAGSLGEAVNVQNKSELVLDAPGSGNYVAVLQRR